MKKFAKIVLILIMLALCIFAVTACNDDNNQRTTTGISISNENMPQTVFVKGNDLDLSAGKLTVSKGKSQNEIALNAEGVKVSGYDKDHVGTQTLTISYDGAETTLSVKVVERMVAENYVSEYVIDEAFNDLGRLTITKDDGSTFSVFLRDTKLTISNFDSSTAGAKNVNVVYNDGELEFAGSFPITVYEAEQVRLTSPTKKAYYSHDDNLDLSGGYFTITAKNGTLTKSIPIDENAVTGFAPWEATEDNSVISQLIHIEYAGKDYTYTINITLTNVTRVKNASAALSTLDWTGNAACQVSAEQGQLAIKALRILYELTETEMTYISDEEILNIVRPAVVYGETQWSAKLSQFPIFSVSNNSLYMDCENLNDMRTQFTAVSALSEDDILFAYGDLLYKTAETVADNIVFGKVTFKKYLANVCTGESIKNAIAQMDWMFKINDAMNAIPADWQVSDLLLPENAAKIEEAHGYLVELGKIVTPIYDRYLFDAISLWRTAEKKDCYDILYRYYFALYLNDDETISEKGRLGIEDMIDLHMPGILETYFVQFVNTLLEAYNLTYTSANDVITEPASSMDTLGFIAAYRTFEKINEAVLNTDDEMIKTLYNVYMSDRFISIQKGEVMPGIFDIMGAACGEPAFEELWTKYINVIYAVGNSDNFSGSIGEQIEDLFASFVALTPELQSQFVASLNPYGSTEFFPSDGTDRPTMFANLYIVYYISVLPENLISLGEENGIVLEMFDALQYYILRNVKIDASTYAISKFVESMKNINTMYGNLSASDKTLFDEHIGFLYEKLTSVYSLYDAKGEFVVKEIAKEWQDQINILKDYYKVLTTFMMLSMQNQAYYPVFISIYEYVIDLYNDIMTNAPQDVKDMALHYNFTDVFEDMHATLETYLYMFRTIYINYLVSYPYVKDAESTLMIWNEYQGSDIRNYFSSLVDFYAVAVSQTNLDDMTPDMIKDAMAGFCALTEKEKSLFIEMDGEGEFVYFKTIGKYFSKVFASSNANLTLADALINLQIDSVQTFNSDSEFIAAWESIANQYADLSAADKELFDANMLETYNYYKGIYDEMKAEQEIQQQENQQ